MNQVNYKNSYAWQEAIELIPLVNRLSDDLPTGEQDTLGGELRRTVIDLATGVAIDLLAQTTSPRLESAIRLETQLEVIRRVYPALDTTTVDQSLGSLIGRLQSDKFVEFKPTPEPPVEPALSDVETEEDGLNSPAEPATNQPSQPAVTSIAVQAETPSTQP